MSNKTTKIKEASGGNRTPDLLITNQLLYQLSYFGIILYSNLQLFLQNFLI